MLTYSARISSCRRPCPCIRPFARNHQSLVQRIVKPKFQSSRYGRSPGIDLNFTSVPSVQELAVPDKSRGSSSLRHIEKVVDHEVRRVCAPAPSAAHHPNRVPLWLGIRAQIEAGLINLLVFVGNQRTEKIRHGTGMKILADLQVTFASSLIEAKHVPR